MSLSGYDRIYIDGVGNVKQKNNSSQAPQWNHENTPIKEPKYCRGEAIVFTTGGEEERIIKRHPL